MLPSPLPFQPPKPLNQGVNTGMTLGPPVPPKPLVANPQYTPPPGNWMGANTPVPTGQQYRSPNGTIDPALRITQMQMSAVETDFKTFFTDMDATGVPNPNLLPAQLDIRTINRLGLDAVELQELGFTRDPVTMNWINSNKTQTTQQQGQVTTAAGTGSADFMGTGFMQYNAANNIEYNNQLRWDPIKKKYRKIGQIEADYGYLPNTNKKQKTLKQKRAEQRAEQGGQPTAASNSNSSYGNVTGNLNTATG